MTTEEFTQLHFDGLPAELPLALADIHRVTAVGDEIEVRLVAPTTSTPLQDAHDQSELGWRITSVREVVAGAGFEVTELTSSRSAIDLTARRAHTLPDVVGPGMRLLICGLNPSLYAADVGVGFARPGNRFWPAALDSGIVTEDRDPRAALIDHGIGFTDLVKRATRRAAEVSRQEYRSGADRVRELVRWLQPDALCFVGLTGYRVAVHAGAVAGWQREPFGSCPTYVMPNPSGINTHSTRADLAAHLTRAVGGPHDSA